MQKEETTNRTVRAFAWASFLNDMGSDMIAPIWPLFVKNVLGANMTALGFVDGLGEALVSISQAASGYVSDRLRKRKVFVWTGYICGAASRLGYAVTQTWPWLVPFKILDRAGKMRGAPRDAIIADVSTDANRGHNFGILRMMDNLGAFVGIIIALLVVQWLGSSEGVLRGMFAIAAVPTVIGVGVVLLFTKEAAQDRTLYKGFSLAHLDRNFALFLGLSALFSLGAFSYSILFLYITELGFKAARVPIMYLLFAGVAALSSIPFGRAADRHGRKIVLVVAFALWGLVLVGLILLQHAPRNLLTLALPFVFYGLHKGAWEPVHKAFVAELAPRDYRASTLGAFQMVTGVCALPASLGAGWLWTRYGAFVPLYASLLLTLLALLLLLFVRPPARAAQ
jgi:MFS family permease